MSTIGALLRTALAAICIALTVAAGPSLAQQQPKRPKVALVLSGGGAMGIAHVGAILELERLGIRPDFVVGTSMGSIVGGLYASGMSGPELKRAVESMDWDAIFDTSPPRDQLSYRRKQQEAEFPVKPSFGVVGNRPVAPAGLVPDANLLLQLRRLIGARGAVKTFDDLPIPFRAVATDIETGQKVVLDQGDLADAMRASMSVPGVFAPQNLHGKLLVDGGMADNLPIDVAREMGADIVIAVITQSPLAKAEDVRSLPQILGQTVALLILANERQQLATIKPTDVLIEVNTGKLGSTDFKKGAQLMTVGSAAAVAREPELRRLADQLGPPVTRIAARPPPNIDYVRVENTSKLADKVLLRYVEPFVGRPMDGDAIALALQRARALGGYSRLDYRIEDRDGRTGLVVEAEQQPGDTRRLRPGLTIAAAGQGHSEFDISLEYRLLQLDANGSEARFAATLGDRKAFSAEYFKVLDGRQKWFVEPSVEFHKRPIAVYDVKGFRLGDYDATYGLGALGIGRQFGTVGEFRFGLQAGGGQARLQEGGVTPHDVDIRTGQVFASGGLDTLNNPYFPTRGYRLTAQYAAGLTGLGENRDFQSASATGLDAISFGPNTLIFNAEGGSRLQGALPLPSLYTLGGPFNLPGYAIEELTGQAYFAGRLMYRRKIVDRSDRLFGLPVYVGATAVTGNTWTKPGAVDFSNLRVGGSLFVATDTLIGPMFLSVGAAERSRYAFYVFVGKPF